MKLDEYRRLKGLPDKTGANKYHAVQTKGKDSGREAKRHDELMSLEKAGIIKNLRAQVRYEIIPAQNGERAAHYTSDHEYDLLDGQHVVEDSKPMFLRKKTDYVLRRKLMLKIYGIKIIEV